LAKGRAACYQGDMIKPHWHSRFLSLAAHIAQWSRDPEKKVGAVIVRPDKTIASLGFNGFPRGVNDDDTRYQDKDLKRELVMHAEMNAILHAREPLQGYTLYVWPLLPCARCAAAIIQAGIAHIVTVPLKDKSEWAETLARAQAMLEESGVIVTVLQEDVTLPELFVG
jgi:dCMP deaminase